MEKEGKADAADERETDLGIRKGGPGGGSERKKGGASLGEGENIEGSPQLGGERKHLAESFSLLRRCRASREEARRGQKLLALFREEGRQAAAVSLFWSAAPSVVRVGLFPLFSHFRKIIGHSSTFATPWREEKSHCEVQLRADDDDNTHKLLSLFWEPFCSLLFSLPCRSLVSLCCVVLSLRVLLAGWMEVKTVARKEKKKNARLERGRREVE